VSGVSAAELDSAGWRRILGPSLLFVASFSAIFVAEGLTATALGSAFSDHEQLLTKIAGALIVLMGVLFVASLFVTRLNREWHVDALSDGLQRSRRREGVVAALDDAGTRDDDERCAASERHVPERHTPHGAIISKRRLRRRRQGRDRPARALVPVARLHEAREQRMRLQRLRLELRMKLHREVPRVVRQLRDFHELAVW